MKCIEYLKDELIKKLTREKIICARSKKAEVRKVFQERNILVKFEEEEKKQGLDGKPKVMLQILW